MVFSITKMTVKVPYATGYRAEREAKKMLERNGYYVMASRGSHGLFDLCAISPDNIKLIQIKVIPYGETKQFKEDQVRIKSFRTAPFVQKELWIYEKRLGWHYFQL